MRIFLGKYYLILLVFLSGLGAQNDSLIAVNHVELNAFGGSESILLKWSLPDSAIINEIAVHRGLNPDRDYSLLTQIDGPLTAWVDTTVNPGQRYFYFIELLTEDGQILISTRDTPPFTAAFHRLSEVDPIFSLNNENRELADSLVTTYFHETLFPAALGRLLPDCPAADINLLARLLHFNSQSTAWLDTFQLSSIDGFSPLAVTFFSQDLQTILAGELDILGLDNRNNLFLTPQEWGELQRLLLSNLPETVMSWQEKYQLALSEVNSLQPVTVIQSSIDSSGVVLIDYLVTAPAALDDRPVQISSVDVTIPLAGLADFYTGQVEGIAVGKSPWIELWIDGEMRQAYLAGEDLRIQATLDGEYLAPVDSGWNQDILRMPDRPLVINEINFTKSTGRLTVELAGAIDSSAAWTLFLNGEPQADFSAVKSDYRLVKLEISDSLAYAWLGLRQQANDTTWLPGEVLPLSFGADFHQARIPDRRNWVRDAYQTLGTANDIERAPKYELTVPDIFALYQNYPNPFNARTTISFDLLRPAIVNLFVTDATGRKIDVFMEDQPTEAGYYQFSWKGHGHSSGVYFFTIQAVVDDYLPVTFSRKMIYLK